jgi:hypothetical protein
LSKASFWLTLGGSQSIGREILSLTALQEEGFVVDDAIPAYAGDERAVLLLVYMLICVGEVEVKVVWAAVTSGI